MTTLSDDELLARAQAALSAWGQRHVLALLETTPSLRAQLVHFERWYRGGLDTYMRHAARLLPDYTVPDTLKHEEEEHDAFVDWLPAVDAAGEGDAPEVAALGSPLFRELEALGAQHVGTSAFVVVAGGLGERLGYHDIKLKLPVETLTRASYLERYAGHLLALEALANEGKAQESERVRIPLAIMTSDVTHDATRAYLTANANFGLRDDQVALVRQEKVPCLDLQPVDGHLQLMLVVDETSRLAMKPHGHGDVHSLLHASGLAAQWQEQGKRYVHFFQDTNALILNSFLPMLGASVRHEWAFNFTTVQRKAKDASGAVVRFRKPQGSDDSEEEEEEVAALFNVEYHELDAFLRAKASTAFPDGDANDPTTGFSLFPGNINHFVIELASYNVVLRASGGFVPEVFNPKTAGSGDARRFKSPARLECMMQDYPKLLVEHRKLLQKTSSRIGLVLFPPALVYSPCKNDVESARDKAQNDIPPQCAGSAEHDLFTANRDKLAALGIVFHGLADDQPREWLGIPLDCSGPQLVFGSSFAPTQAKLSSRFSSPPHVRISRRSTLVVEGDVTIRSLELDGALRVSACAGASVEITNLRVQNAGYAYTAVELTERTDPIDAMRGYTFAELGLRELSFDAPGHYTVDEA